MERWLFWRGRYKDSDVGARRDDGNGERRKRGDM